MFVRHFKKIIREKIFGLLRNQKEADRAGKSRIIKKKLFARPEFKNSKTIMFYASFDGEVDTSEMIKQAIQRKKRVALPRIYTSRKQMIPALVRDLGQSLEKGPYGIRQPKLLNNNRLSIAELDLVIVPGIAYDKNNHRLGRGAGYYDRFLSRLDDRIPTIGLAFDFQIVDQLPIHEGRDIPVSHVIVN